MDDLITRLRDHERSELGIGMEAADEIEKLRDALNTAGGALHRWVIFAEDDDEREQQQHVRDVGLLAVKDALRPNVANNRIAPQPD